MMIHYEYKDCIEPFKEAIKNNELIRNSKIQNSDFLLQILKKRWEVMAIPYCHRFT